MKNNIAFEEIDYKSIIEHYKMWEKLITEQKNNKSGDIPIREINGKWYLCEWGEEDRILKDCRLQILDI